MGLFKGEALIVTFFDKGIIILFSGVKRKRRRD